MGLAGAGQGGITAPGSICATPVEAPIDIEEGLPVEIPLVYYYGHTSPETNPDLYRTLVSRMAAMLDRRTQQNTKVRGCHWPAFDTSITSRAIAHDSDPGT